MRIKVMTYNIAGGRDYSEAPKSVFKPESCAGVIAGFDADIVGLNEVDKSVPRSEFIDLCGYLADRLGYKGIFAPAIHFCGGLYGNAFLTRLPVVSSEIIAIPDPVGVDLSVHIESRCILRAVLGTEQRELCVLVTHFGLSEPEQMSAVSTLLGIIERESRPIILMGDFNLERDNEIIRPIMNILKSAGDSLPEGTYSFPSYKCADGDKIMIDYIMASDRIKFEDVCVHDICKSDHKPMTATIVL